MCGFIQKISENWNYPTTRHVALDEPCEATSGGKAVLKPVTVVCQVELGLSGYGRCAAGRSLARLVNCYGAEPVTAG